MVYFTAPSGDLRNPCNNVAVEWHGGGVAYVHTLELLQSISQISLITCLFVGY